MRIIALSQRLELALQTTYPIVSPSAYSKAILLTSFVFTWHLRQPIVSTVAWPLLPHQYGTLF